MITNSIARRLKLLLRNRRMSKFTLAEKLDVEVALIDKWLDQTKICSITIQHLKPLCDILNIPVKWLVTGKTDKHNCCVKAIFVLKCISSMDKHWLVSKN